MRWLTGTTALSWALVMLLAGCGGGEHEDIKKWMEESSRDLRGNVAPLPDLKIPPIVSYDPMGNSDPFSSMRVEPEKVETGGKKPDFNRPKEPLESYPLESLSFKGVVANNKDGKRYALIMVDNVMHHVAVGRYMGENFGRIIEISDTEVKLVETIQDPTGQTRDWVERGISLYLPDSGQGKEVRK